MHIEAMQKLTLLDYPGKTAATLFTHGCNFRCPFCHNAGLVIRPSELAINNDEVFEFLEKRKRMLEGICITGGEPLLNNDIAEFIAKVKDIGYAVKLDTNGSFPERLEELINARLVDKVAMDIKNSKAKYPITAGISQSLMPKIEKSVKLLLENRVDYEFRTTVTQSLHTEEDMREIGKWILGAENYFIQPFKDSGDIVAGSENAPLYECKNAHAEALLAAVREFLPNAQIRG